MSATLSPQIESRFAAATDVEGFFGKNNAVDIRRKFEKREQPIMGVPRDSCTTNLFFGFFFDGTKNNYIQAEAAKNHSNVARLYDCYPGLSVHGVLPEATDWQLKDNRTTYSHFFKAYIPGVASPFPGVNDGGVGWSEKAGAAAGAFSERRVIWALVQAINNVHRYFLKTPLVLQPELDGLLRRLVLNKEARGFMDSGHGWGGLLTNDMNTKPRQEFEKILLRLHSAISRHWPDERTGKPAKIDPGIVKTIYVSTFGFSRGATQARAFTNWLQSLCRLDAQLRGKPGDMSLGGFSVQFDFLGLFDTVASVGPANTIGFFNGHSAWADTEDSLRIPAGVKCLHLVAAHELRRSFPVDSISVKGLLPEGCEEIVVPGVHSDVGCGYAPREQGRGTDPSGADMLARIPLLLMYKAARLNGVPLKLEMANATAQARFALDAKTIAAFNAYIGACKEKHGPLHLIMREQARKQMEWRLVRCVSGKAPLQETASFLRATTFEQNDLYSAGREFEKEIDAFLLWRKEKGKGFKPASQKAGFDNEYLAEWEEIATWWGKWSDPTQDVLQFFDNYVHDSRAWFKLKGADNEKDMRAQLDEWVRMRKASEVRKQMSSKMHGRGNSSANAVGDGLSEDQRRAAEEYSKTGQIPRMFTEGREPFGWGGAGYLRFRKIYGGWDSELLSAVPAGEAGSVPDAHA